MYWLKTLPILFVCCGCLGAGLHRHTVHTRLQDDSFCVDDLAIEQAMAIKPQLALPCRMAIYLNAADRGDRLAPSEKQLVEAWAKVLKSEGIAADVFVMSDMFLPKEKKGIREIRLAAARHGADVVLVVQGECRTDAYLNPAAVLNLTIAGGFIIPASHRDSLYTLQAAVVDVGNGYLYAVLETEGEGKIIRPTFLVEDRDAVTKAKRQALEQFGQELLERMRALKAELASTPLRSKSVAERPQPLPAEGHATPVIDY